MAEQIVAAHQPNYLPWIGYFHKIHNSDAFLLLDDVEYTSGSWINRNRVKTPNGWTWVTVPVQSSTGPIYDVRIATQEDWREEHLKTFSHNYGGTEYFDDWRQFLDETYNREWERLDKLDRHIIDGICDRVGLETDFVRSSTFDIAAVGSERIAALCEALDADVYLCGMGADEYMDESDFEAVGVHVEYQSFEHPKYCQRFDGFIPKLSFIDMVLNVGADRSREILGGL